MYVDMLTHCGIILTGSIRPVTRKGNPMETWQVISNYKVHGLAFAVDHVQRCYRRRLGVNSKTARRMALIHVRTSLAQAIDNGSFYHG